MIGSVLKTNSCPPSKREGQAEACVEQAERTWFAAQAGSDRGGRCFVNGRLPAQRSGANRLVPRTTSSEGGGVSKPPRPKLSVAIIALDEEDNLPGLLERLDWADEIVVIDGGSRDGTVEVARRYADRVSVNPFRNYAEQRNRAVAECRGEWVLFVDADERPGPGFAEEVRQRVETRKHKYAAFRVPIHSSIFGRRFRHSGTQDDRPIRLVRRDGSCWQGAVHEVARVQGRVGRLDAGLWHETLPTLRAFLAKMDRYTNLEATHRRAARCRPGLWELAWRPPLEVFRRLVWKGGLLDGPAGWAFCLLSGVSTAVALLKCRADGTNAEAMNRVLKQYKPWLDRVDGWIAPRWSLTGEERLPLSPLMGVGRGGGEETRVQAPHPNPPPQPGEGIAWEDRRARAIENAVADRFDQLAGRFHEGIDADDVRVRALFRHFGDVRGKRILDLACGKGRYLHWLEQAGARAVGVDLSRRMLSGGSCVEGVCCARGGRLPFRDGSFDAVCCIEGLSHFPDPARTLGEAARVLRLGGRLVLIDKNAASLDWRRPWLPGLAVKWLDEHRGRWMYPPGFAYRERWFLLPGLARMLGRAFRQVASEYLLSRLEERSAGRMLFRRLPPLRHFMVIACVKR